MNRRDARELVLIGSLCAMLAVVVVSASTTGAAQEVLTSVPDPSTVPGEVEVGKPSATVILQVYSGRRNPQWSLEGDQLDTLLALVDNLEVSKEELFDYAEWNRLGYASFRVELHGAEKGPRVVHVWRDFAVFFGEGREPIGQAIGASDLYELLVRQAEERDLGELFTAYRKSR